MAASSTFIKITNKDIFRRIEDMEKSNTKQHEQILIHQKETNGKVKLNRWIATTCITMILALAGIVFSLL